MMENIALIVILAFVMEAVDSGLGMGYGTVLSPLLIIFGYSPNLAVPAILFSQALGGFTASILHHKYGNADFMPKLKIMRKLKEERGAVSFFDGCKMCFSRDAKISILITAFGIAATIIGANMAVKIPKYMLKIYIGVLVVVMGSLLLLKREFNFSWRKIFCLGIVSAFNKGVSGGGFGPLMTGGQVMSGNNPKGSIGSTTLAEAPICVAGFLTYIFTKGMASYNLLIILSIGAIFGGVFGPAITSRINLKKLKYIMGVMILIEGVWVLVRVFTDMRLG